MAARRVAKAVEQGYQVAVVVSALGRRGDPYATDTLLDLIKPVNGLSTRDVDLLLFCGEVIAAVVVAATLQRAGLPAVPLTGWQAGIITDQEYGEARILEIRPQRILEHLQAGRVAVVAGFQGITETGEITTLGRGGSDTTAAALGVALQAEAVEIYTDVNGVKTADPSLVPSAKTLEHLTYREVCEMAHLGAKVIHPRAVEIAMAGSIPLWVRSTFEEEAGTQISVRVAGDRLVTGIAHSKGLAQVRVRSEEDLNEEGRALRALEALARHSISLDMIHLSPETLCFVVPEERLDEAASVLKEQGFAVETRRSLAKVSAVGAGMRGIPGVMARVVRALSAEGIPIFQTSDSHANISCLVWEKDLARAVQALHTAFAL